MTIHGLTSKLRSGEVTPEQALDIFAADLVLVDDQDPPGDNAELAEVDDYAENGHGLFHALRFLGAGALIPEFDAEIVRARVEGRVY